MSIDIYREAREAKWEDEQRHLDEECDRDTCPFEHEEEEDRWIRHAIARSMILDHVDDMGGLDSE